MGKRLTTKEKETLQLLNTLSIKQIASRRGCSVQAVYKIINKAKDKGVENIGFKKRGGGRVLPQNFKPFSKSYIRLHGMQFSIRLIMKKPFYDKVRRRGDWVVVDSHKVRLSSDSLDVYQDSDSSFYGVDESVVTDEAFNYWDRFFLKLENRFKIVIVKDQYQNIRLVKSHYARINDGVAKKVNTDKKKVEVYAEDGKLRFVIDNSLGFNESETVHVNSNKEDMCVYREHINDWLVSHPPTNSQLASHIASLIKDREYYAENLRSHVTAINDLGKGIKELNKLVEELKK